MNKLLQMVTMLVVQAGSIITDSASDNGDTNGFMYKFGIDQTTKLEPQNQRGLTSNVFSNLRIAKSFPKHTRTTTQTTTKMNPPVTTAQTIQGNIQICPKNVQQRSGTQYIYQHGVFCYVYSSRTGSWFDAKDDCYRNGGVLFYIQNEHQQNFILQMLLNLYEHSPVWLGLQDQAQEESWQWISNEPLRYINWMPGRFIDDFHDEQDCGLFVPVRHGQWDDVICKGTLFSEPVKHHWICQYNVTTTTASSHN